MAKMPLAKMQSKPTAGILPLNSTRNSSQSWRPSKTRQLVRRCWTSELLEEWTWRNQLLTYLVQAIIPQWLHLTNKSENYIQSRIHRLKITRRIKISFTFRRISSEELKATLVSQICCINERNHSKHCIQGRVLMAQCEGMHRKVRRSMSQRRIPKAKLGKWSNSSEMRLTSQRATIWTISLTLDVSLRQSRASPTNTSGRYKRLKYTMSNNIRVLWRKPLISWIKVH